ncbi:hypothetical protein BX616_007335 [Lobosporangium transversale]|uniref:Superoxide dismutase n=1 Tax=Lobosporangium transversale TaxID=64571 RepID=A0A1Y2GDE1_9FUNG|nr:superoxide dismutase [Lobosporangium transversale]KAF9896492.1 hypothetical protein BX616_007335 [Lobosporangium transversale]ORZ05931.1 superoxide dismutase [Lobosporangium transversale]|eukprot:XP_021877312.1 superoxide dismutase [Lobosporangium transversale]
MLFKSIATVLTIAGLAAAQTPTEYTKGVAHIKKDNIDAIFTFEKVAEGTNVTVDVKSGLTQGLQILPAGFEYHIHVKPVGANGDCMATGGHLNPGNAGKYPCDKTSANFTACEIGDLSGKHGNLVAANNDTGAIPPLSYVDSQLSFSGPTESALLGRSVVIHNNGTRIACANLVVEGYTAPEANSTSPTTVGSTPLPTKDSSAVKLVASLTLSGLVAAMMLAL